MNWINSNLDVFLFAIAVILIICEMTMMIGVLLFTGIGSLVGALLAYFGVIDNIYEAAITVAIATTVASALLWKPFKNFQNKKYDDQGVSDMIGKILIANSDISQTEGSVRFSDATLSARILSSTNESIPSGTSVKVVSVNGTTMFVEKA